MGRGATGTGTTACVEDAGMAGSTLTCCTTTLAPTFDGVFFFLSFSLLVLIFHNMVVLWKRKYSGKSHFLVSSRSQREARNPGRALEPWQCPVSEPQERGAVCHGGSAVECCVPPAARAWECLQIGFLLLVGVFFFSLSQSIHIWKLSISLRNNHLKHM